ncbi:MAG: hypothetical protein HY372_01160 [Candidatus Andersenbacteria bacterium]|nr:hypothetical protein [Candidatus Andersenbacteria bacterium]
MATLGDRILWRRARDYLHRYQPTLIGITGSSGTTLVKDALALALAPILHLRTAPFRHHTLRGLALAILGAKSPKLHRHWLRLLTGSHLRELIADEPNCIVLDLPAHQPGELDAVARALTFQVVAVTNTETINLHLFPSLEMIAHEQASLISALPQNGTVCLNADDKLVAAHAARTKARIIWFGESASADIRLVRTHRLTTGLAAEWRILGRPLELHLPHIIGRHQLSYLSAALAVIAALDIKTHQAAQRLAQIRPPAGNLRLFEGQGGAQIIDGSYEVSPESMMAALATLSEIPSRRNIAILGDLPPLGAHQTSCYEKIGQRAAQTAAVLVTVGENIRTSGAAALQAGGVDVHHFADSRDVGKWLVDFLHAGDTVLICGSHNLHLERVVERLLAHPDRDRDQLIKDSREEPLA